MILMGNYIPTISGINRWRRRSASARRRSMCYSRRQQESIRDMSYDENWSNDECVEKIRLSTTSSTETEVVSAKERFPKCIWFRCFRLAQGASSKMDALTQDCQSFMSLHDHRPFSIGRGSKHVKAR